MTTTIDATRPTHTPGETAARRCAVLAGTLAGVLGAACGVGGGSATTGDASQQGQALPPATVSFTTWWMPPLAFGIATEKALRDFESKQPNVKVKVEGMADNTGANLEKVQTLLAAGTPPDLSLSRPPHMGFFANRVSTDTVGRQLKRGDLENRRVATKHGPTWQARVSVLPLTSTPRPHAYNGAGSPTSEAVAPGYTESPGEASPDLLRLINRLHQENCTLAVEVGFVQAELQQAHETIRSLQAELQQAQGS